MLVYRFISYYLLKKYKQFFFSVYDRTTEGIKQRFEQTYYMVYCSVQYVVAIGIKGNKIEDQVNQTAPFYQGDLVKQKIKFTLKVSGIMINAKLN